MICLWKFSNDVLLPTGVFQPDISVSMGQAPTVVSNLVERFDRNREAYKNHSYNETQVRREFLDPFLEALGWDVANKGTVEESGVWLREDADGPNDHANGLRGTSTRSALPVGWS